MKTTTALHKYMLFAFLLSFVSVSSQAIDLSQLLNRPVTNGRIIKTFLMTPSLQEIMKSKVENKNLIEQGPIVLSVHDVVNLATACAVNYVWVAHVNKENPNLVHIAKTVCLGEAGYRALVALGEAVGFSQSLSPELRHRVASFVSPFLREVCAEVALDILQK